MFTPSLYTTEESARFIFLGQVQHSVPSLAIHARLEIYYKQGKCTDTGAQFSGGSEPLSNLSDAEHFFYLFYFLSLVPAEGRHRRVHVIIAMSKRDADNQDAANKRRRLSTPSNDELEALLNDDDNEVLLNDITSGSDEGFIAGSIQSTWPPTKKNLRIKLDTFTTCNRNGKVTFDIEVIFVADCLHAINKLEPESQFEVGDHIKLALHGFSVTTSTGSSGIVKLRLTFEDGAAFMFLAKPRHPEQTHKLISIWPGTSRCNSIGPASDPSSDRKRERYRVSLETTPEWFATPQDAASPTENDVPKVEATSPIVLPPVKISKAEKKRLRSQKHRQESFHRTSADLKKTIQTARESLDREPPPVSSEVWAITPLNPTLKLLTARRKRGSLGRAESRCWTLYSPCVYLLFVQTNLTSHTGIIQMSGFRK